MTESVREYWNAQAERFDSEPDHGLSDPATRQAWHDLLRRFLPEPPADVVDLGCGTGTLSVLLAEDGYRVHGLDVADQMVQAARRKAESLGSSARFRQGDAARPPYPRGSFDVVLSRHVLWALPDPLDAVRAWTRLLRPDGCLLLVEGRWSTGAGLGPRKCERLVRQVRQSATVHAMQDPVYWGGPITDERYLLVSTS